MKAHVSKQHTKPTSATPQGSLAEEKPSRGMPASQKLQPFDDLHARIMVRAYELYVERGYREGYAEQDWLDAEREIVGRTFPV